MGKSSEHISHFLMPGFRWFDVGLGPNVKPGEKPASTSTAHLMLRAKKSARTPKKAVFQKTAADSEIEEATHFFWQKVDKTETLSPPEGLSKKTCS